MDTKDYLNLDLGDIKIIRRNRFSKTYFYTKDWHAIINNPNDLPFPYCDLLSEILKVQENPKDYFNYEYIQDSNSYLITKYIGKDIKNLVFPAQIDDIPVILGERLIDSNKDIEYVYIPDGINTLPPKLCSNTPQLYGVYLNPEIKIIPLKCFDRCLKLKKINTENIKEIKQYAFYRCDNLDKLNLDNLEKIAPEGLESCYGLTYLSLPKIKTLSVSAFENCRALEEVILNDNLTEIPASTFFQCVNLKKVILPKKLIEINPYAFADCKSLNKINLPENLKKINISAFEGSGITGNLYVPKNLEEISMDAFTKTKITSVEMSIKTSYNDSSFPMDALTNIKYYDKNKEEIENPKER